MDDAPALEGFTSRSFTAEVSGRPLTRFVYRRGAGPGVVVIHEIPGITPEVARFARLVADAGFTVELPWLVGTPGRPLTTGYALASSLRVCVSREFRILAAHEASPIVDWLRALARALHREVGGKGVGAIGMCVTGNFALTMALDPEMLAPVLGQPSLPFPVLGRGKCDVHASPQTLAEGRRRCDEEQLTVLGLRFTADPVSPPERFETLRAALGRGFESIEIDSSKGNRWNFPQNAHSVVTTALVMEEGHPTKVALDRVLSFFRERLQP
ncbi:MAG: dienelactone hydrolase family protein [Polyangiales bacterium]